MRFPLADDFRSPVHRRDGQRPWVRFRALRDIDTVDGGKMQRDAGFLLFSVAPSARHAVLHLNFPLRAWDDIAVLSPPSLLNEHNSAFFFAALLLAVDMRYLTAGDGAAHEEATASRRNTADSVGKAAWPWHSIPPGFHSPLSHRRIHSLIHLADKDFWGVSSSREGHAALPR